MNSGSNERDTKKTGFQRYHYGRHVIDHVLLWMVEDEEARRVITMESLILAQDER